MTDDELKAIRERSEKAAPRLLVTDDGPREHGFHVENAREDILALLDEVERLRAAIRESLETFPPCPCQYSDERGPCSCVLQDALDYRKPPA